MEVTEWRANGTMRKGRARRMEKETASRQRLLAISRHSPRTLATWEGFVKDGLKNIRTKKRRREEPAEDAFHFTVAQLALQNLDFDHCAKKVALCAAVYSAGSQLPLRVLGSLGTVAVRGKACEGWWNHIIIG
ncbi:hypothetical protein EMIHUDRAFT_248301 [Emiliania huxleyi CCMP1516]|uniref:Uncharacterized protein n=2 Tax=Emiliania huxleyi TaxID=2903 RepID=A0A0D3IH43_EMIH1|nr:hypothetical protein EMIHUDRAFT_248301 [Emiliania huxleyi CCMP1516]EOD10578.1 hypothetical protein EMIHUDRAFT_248301 [Emiliania huxleyi CCMP1516]|eukprot:XP_005763007.1 hypothetical protein EMIHUDRAFT_248301 [Emiliania huxleyi CCMP1516]